MQRDGGAVDGYEFVLQGACAEGLPAALLVCGDFTVDLMSRLNKKSGNICIPLTRRSSLLLATISRLEDKSCGVRKEAVRLLALFVETHPFWLDGQLLDAELYRQRIFVIEMQLEQATHERVDDDGDRGMENLSKPSTTTPFQSTTDVTSLEKQLTYYNHALMFTNQLETASPLLLDLLMSKTKTDVVECMNYFVVAYKHSLPSSKVPPLASDS